MDASGDIVDAAGAAPPAVAEAAAGKAFRDVSPRWLRAFKGLTHALWFVLLPAIFILTYALVSHYGIGVGLLGVLLPGWLLALIVHECGHWAVARWRGMLVVQVVIVWLEIQPRRRGLRLRRVRARLRGTRGYVVSYPDPARDPRRDTMWFTLGGPLANAFAAALCGLTAWWLGRSPAQALWVLWGLLHLLGFVFNLIPRTLGDVLGSDGLAWARLRFNRFEDLPGAAFSLVQGHLLRGGAIDAVPAAAMRRLAQEPAPMPALHDWLSMAAALDAGRLGDAEIGFEGLCARIEAYPEPTRAGLVDLLMIAWTDLVFLRVLQRGDADDLAALDDLSLDPAMFWYLPHVPPRARALAAARRGDLATARAQLARSRRYADNSPFLATVSSEARLRERIEAIIAADAATDSPPLTA